MKLVNELLSFGDLLSVYESAKKEERKEIEYEWIWKEIAQPKKEKVAAPIIAPLNVPVLPPKINPNSYLLEVSKHWETFKKWFDGRDFELTLIYRGTEKQFSTAKFHEIVDNQGPTLHVVKSEHDHIFGGVAF
jgi:hypothetical protein